VVKAPAGLAWIFTAHYVAMRLLH